MNASPYGVAPQSVPYDPTKAALALLGHTASKMSAALLPLAELSPNGTVVSNTNNVASGSISTGTTVQWPCDGILVGIRATTRDGLAASMAGCILRVQINGTRDLFPSAAGNGSGYMPLAMISGVSSSYGRYACRVLFQQATAWTFYLQNTTAGALVVDVGFDFVNTSNTSQ